MRPHWLGLGRLANVPQTAAAGCEWHAGREFMYRTILLAYNSSTRSDVALRQAVHIARWSNSKLHILGILTTSGGLALAQATGSLDVVVLARESMEKNLSAVARSLRDEGIDVTTSVEEGDIAQHIVAYVAAEEVDLVVLGNPRQGIIARWLNGAVGAKLQSQLHCNLLVVEEQKRSSK